IELYSLSCLRYGRFWMHWLFQFSVAVRVQKIERICCEFCYQLSCAISKFSLNDIFIISFLEGREDCPLICYFFGEIYFHEQAAVCRGVKIYWVCHRTLL